MNDKQEVYIEENGPGVLANGELFHELYSREELAKFKRMPGFKVILFTAPWLEAGILQKNMLLDLFEQRKENCSFASTNLDIGDIQEYLIDNGFASFPLTLIFKDSELVGSSNGATSIHEIENKIV